MHILYVHYYLAYMVVTTHADYELTKSRRSEPAGILNMMYYMHRFGLRILFREYWSDAFVKSSE